MPPPDSLPPDPRKTPPPRPEDDPPDAPSQDNPPSDRPPGELTGYIRRFLANDPEGRELLFAHTYERFRTLASQMLRGFPQLRREFETGDILHQTYLKIDRALRQRANENADHLVPIENSEHLAAYAATAMRNELIDLARRFRRRPGASNGLDQVPGDDKDPSELAQIAETHEKVGRLPDHLRRTVELLHYQKLTQREAAGVLGCDPRTVARWYAQALVLLGLGPQGGGK